MSEFITTKHVARRLNLTSTRIQQLCNEGKLRVAARAGRMRLFVEADVEAFEAARAGKAA